MPNAGESVVVVHAGALGDGVLLWPMLRSMAARCANVTLVTHDSKGALAARALAINSQSIESATWRALWNAAQFPRTSVAETTPGNPQRLLSFVADGEHGVWAANARARFPRTVVEVIGRRLDRQLAIELAQREGGAGLTLPIRQNPLGPAVLHVGAGSASKRWGMARWEALAPMINGPLRVIAGEVEAEQFSSADRAAFERLGGVFLTDLFSLADLLAGSRTFVGCDSGPAHLAAQLGVPTVCIFRSTSPDEWAPIGPAVRVVGSASVDATVRDVASACLSPWPAQ